MIYRRRTILLRPRPIIFGAAAGGPVVVTPDPVVATWSTVASIRLLVAVQAPVIVTWSTVAPAQRLVAVQAPVVATWSTTAPARLLVVAQSPVSATWTVVTPVRRLVTVRAAVVATWATPAPSATAGAVAQPGSVIATWSTVAPTRSLVAQQAVVVATWSMVAPAQRLTVSVSPVVATWIVVSPTTNGTTPAVVTIGGTWHEKDRTTTWAELRDTTWREWRPTTWECTVMAIPIVPKRSAEVRDFFFEFGDYPELRDAGETLASVQSVSVTLGSGLTVGSTGVVGTKVRVSLSGGVRDVRYELQCTVRTNAAHDLVGRGATYLDL